MAIGLLVISGIFAVIGMIISGTLRRKFERYSQVALTKGQSGAEVAAAMLRHYGLPNVEIRQVDGQLTDHYNPADRSVSLSYDVYYGRSVAAAAVAAHECGHAVQHAQGYAALQMRSALVPIVNIAAPLQQYIFLFGIAGSTLLHNSFILYLALAAYGVMALFSLITLPVEFDASRRALVWLDETGYARGAEYAGAKDALTWAAMTYIAAALAAVVQFLFLLLRLLSSRD